MFKTFVLCCRQAALPALGGGLLASTWGYFAPIIPERLYHSITFGCIGGVMIGGVTCGVMFYRDLRKTLEERVRVTENRVQSISDTLKRNQHLTSFATRAGGKGPAA